MANSVHLPALGLTLLEVPDGRVVTSLDRGGLVENSGQVDWQCSVCLCSVRFQFIFAMRPLL